ncbi:transporter substrate-binding domain-containing protein [Kiloniella laminariae]|uniref:Transporter substrate-binding domain-containing protein n=1 Tax=Kiloniella laminariae TaxID=454162 RepID=A0ABT4LGD9_9PROT|nr:transporter substrate-binding domain-containing protein [Kiloniella laminariae]MCZ4280178.1 transporter substrate-binding domain-containing protein [Kiloniella laminariae]
MAYAETWAPISSGQGPSVEGILPSIIDEVISRRMGIEVEHQGLPWARAQEMVRSGGVDAFITTPTMERMAFSSSSTGVVFTLRFQPVVRKGSEEERLLRTEEDLTRYLASRRYCDVLGNGWATRFYKDKALAYVVVPTIDICLKHLAEGKADIVVHATPVVQNFMNQLDLTDEIVILQLIMASSPDFPLLLSKKSSFGKGFLDKFDETLAEIKALGIWEVLVNPGAVSSN